jgi:two-component system nitrate/nitrite response regulator NarL
VFLVDDDDSLRGFLASLLEGRGIATRQAATGEEALEATQEEAPAVAVLDICLPGISGYQVCRDLRERFGDGLPIMFISAARTESCDRAAALLVGGDDYLEKPISADEFLIRVSRMIRRSAPLSPAVSGRLTAREQQVLRLIAEGLGPRDIASRLVIADKTVSTHIDHIFRKLGVHSRTQAVAVAFQRNLLTTPVQT